MQLVSSEALPSNDFSMSIKGFDPALGVFPPVAVPPPISKNLPKLELAVHSGILSTTIRGNQAMSSQSHTIRQAIEDSIAKGGSTADVTERVMGTLDEMKLIAYSGRSAPSLLTVNGRVLMLLMEYPDMGLRELGTRIGSTESSVSRAVASLIEGGLVKRYKVKGRNRYSVNPDRLLEHADLRRFFLSVEAFLSDQ